jgi:uncharacterized protein GlcG (DUF336 family)
MHPDLICYRHFEFTGASLRFSQASEGVRLMSGLSLGVASLIVDKALERGRELGLAPLTVVVLDAGGHLKVAKREDGASLLRPDIAMGKAWGVLGMGFGGRELARRAARAPQFFTALTELAAGRMVAVAGGVLIRTAAGDIVGAIGISGDASEKDEDCAVFGIVAAGLVADTGGEDPR